MIIAFDTINGVYEIGYVEDGHVLIDENYVFDTLKNCEDNISYACEVSKNTFDKIKADYGIYK